MLDQDDLMMQVHTGRCLSCWFLSEIPARKGVLITSLCFFMWLLRGTQPASFLSTLLAPTLSPAWLPAILPFLLLSIVQEDHDTFWQGTPSEVSKQGGSLWFPVFEIREPAHNFATDKIYLTPQCRANVLSTVEHREVDPVSLPTGLQALSGSED